MIDLTTAMARLALRHIEESFSGDDPSPMIRLTCLSRPEIVALVQALRQWRPPTQTKKVHIAVTVKSAWPELLPTEMVPREDMSPTRLRNEKDAAVILIVGEDFTDKQSWQNVHSISDTALVSQSDSRTFLIGQALTSEAPALLVEVIEEIYKAVGSGNQEQVPVRKWVSFVIEVCRLLQGCTVIDASTAWSAVGQSLAEIDLFPDEQLAPAAPTDRNRRLRRNSADSHRLLFEADDRWRDTLQERVNEVEFLDGEGRPDSNQTPIRETLERLLGAEGAREQRNVQFRHWLRIVEPSGERLGLGNRIREHIQSSAPDRVQEYDDLGLSEGIDSGSPEDAQALLDAAPPREELVPLVRLLTEKQVTAIERIANPRAASTTAPLAEILRVVADMVTERVALFESSSLPKAQLIVEPRKLGDSAVHSRALFAWLFSPVLRQVADVSKDETHSLCISRELSSSEGLSDFERIDACEEDDELDGAFDTLELRIRWSDSNGRERRIDWSPRETPGLAALWRLAERDDVSSWEPGAEVDFDMWLMSATQHGPMVGRKTDDEQGSMIVSQWRQMRKDALNQISDSGLTLEVIDQYVDQYRQVLATLRNDYVPAGAARPEVKAVLGGDLYHSDGGVVLLATHPIRLRWIGCYLREISRLILQALHSELSTNPVNPDLFFTELLDVSPQAQPPIAVVGERLCVATREQDWHEVFAPLRDERSERRDWLADLDDGAIDDVAETIGRYLDAYPHKADGLHLLYIVRQHGARGLHRLVKHLVKRIRIRGASLKLTLCVDPS
jgi:DNA segregation ATPase FtsK/SpoIIIE, S-DNA-T family